MANIVVHKLFVDIKEEYMLEAMISYLFIQIKTSTSFRQWKWNLGLKK
jgi:hypothetical protein